MAEGKEAEMKEGARRERGTEHCGQRSGVLGSGERSSGHIPPSQLIFPFIRGQTSPGQTFHPSAYLKGQENTAGGGREGSFKMPHAFASMAQNTAYPFHRLCRLAMR